MNLAETEADLLQMATAFAHSRDLAATDLLLSGKLHRDELRGLARSIDVGLIDIDDCGTFRAMGSRKAKGPYNLFSRGPRPALNREYLVQIAAFTELVLDYGWPSVRTAFEHDALDLATFDREGRCQIAGEAKTTEGLLATMITEIGRMTPEQLQAPESNAERTVAALVRLQAPVFWAVAPGVRWSFEVDYSHEIPALIPRQGLPVPALEDRLCPVCGSEDLHGDPTQKPIPLLCQDCGYRWLRNPRPVCRRCDSTDVDVTVNVDWTPEDKKQPFGAFDHVDRQILRCRKCSWEGNRVLHRWQPPASAAS
jgi:hypothetical protein